MVGRYHWLFMYSHCVALKSGSWQTFASGTVSISLPPTVEFSLSHSGLDGQHASSGKHLHIAAATHVANSEATNIDSGAMTTHAIDLRVSKTPAREWGGETTCVKCAGDPLCCPPEIRISSASCHYRTRC